MAVRRTDFKGGAAWDSGPFSQKTFMNSDSGGKRDSEEYNNPTERQDEQAARHQDEGIYRLEMFVRNGVLFTIDAPLF